MAMQLANRQNSVNSRSCRKQNGPGMSRGRTHTVLPSLALLAKQLQEQREHVDEVQVE